MRRVSSSPSRSVIATPLLALLALVALGAAACSVPVAAGLDETDANSVVVALDHVAIDASKEADPAAEGKFRVLVTRDDVARALGTMRDEELPRAKSPGVLDAMGKGSLVPSEAAEHAQFVAGLAGDLQRTLESIDGVLGARVHLNVPEAEPFARDAMRPRPSASVLLEHRGSTPPISVDSVQRLVAGGVEGLFPNDVTVILISRPAPAAPGASALAHVGPIAVARASMRALQGALVGLIGLVAILAALTIFLYTRAARLRAELQARPGSPVLPSPRGSQPPPRA